VFYEFWEGVLRKKIPDALRQFQGSQNLGDEGPVFAADLGEAADTFDTGGFLELAVIGGFF